MLECILRKTLTGEIPRVVLITITLLDVNNKKGKKLQLHQKYLCIQYEISSVNNFKQLEKWVIHISDVHITNFTYGQIPFNDVVIILIADADLRFIFIFINFNIELFNILLLFFFFFWIICRENAAKLDQCLKQTTCCSQGCNIHRGNLTIVITALFTYRRLPVCGGSPGSPAVPLVLVGRR